MTARNRRRRPQPNPQPNVATQPRTRRRRRRTRRGRGPQSAANEALIERICSQTDPFCEAARGAKLFDRDTSQSVGVQIREFVALTTDASGQCTLQINPRLNDYRRTAATYTGATVATWNAASDIPSYAALGALYDMYRIVSIGARVVPIVAPLSASGLVVWQTTNSAEDVDLTSDTYNEVHRESLHDCKGAWVGKRYHNTSDYEAFTSTGENMQTVNISVYAGPASTTVLGVEIVMNIEVVPIGDQAGALYATPAWPHDLTVESATSSIAGGVSALFTSGVNGVKDYVMARAREVAYMGGVAAASAVRARVVGPNVTQRLTF